MKICAAGVRAVVYGQTDRRDKANSLFSQLSELSQKALEGPVCYRHRILT